MMVAAAAVFFTTLTGAANASVGVTNPTPTDYVAKAIHDQLLRKPGGVVTNGNTITYAAEDIQLTYQPTYKTAAGMAPAAIWGCSTGQVCFYSNGDHTGLRLATNSLWCPRERTTRSFITFSDWPSLAN